MKRKYTKEELIKFEHYISNLFELGKINVPIHLSGGNEEALITIFKGVQDADYVFSGHRNHYHYLLKGGSPHKLVEELLGSKGGVNHGAGRSMHIFEPRINFYTSGIVGGVCAPAVGVGLSLKKLKSKAHVWCFVGDGGEDTGAFMEAVRFSVARVLPITFVVEDNDLAVESSKKDRWHNYPMFNSPNILRYEYKRAWPHVGVGKHVSM